MNITFKLSTPIKFTRTYTGRGAALWKLLISVRIAGVPDVRCVACNLDSDWPLNDV